VRNIEIYGKQYFAMRITSVREITDTTEMGGNILKETDDF